MFDWTRHGKFVPAVVVVHEIKSYVKVIVEYICIIDVFVNGWELKLTYSTWLVTEKEVKT